MKPIMQISFIICIIIIVLVLFKFLNLMVGITFLIIGLSLFVYYNKIDKSNDFYTQYPINYTPPKYPINYALLLCMHNTKCRQYMYLDVIKYYIDVLKFPKNNIFIVDSSGNGVDDKYIYIKNQVVFKQQDYKIKQLQYKSIPSKYEILSLLIASKHLNFKPFTYVIKLTCKYKIPELYTIENNMNSILLLQNKTFKKEQYSEIFGIHTKYFIDIINIILNQTNDISVEHILYKLSKMFPSQQLPFLSNKATYKRNDGSFLPILSH